MSNNDEAEHDFSKSQPNPYAERYARGMRAFTVDDDGRRTETTRTLRLRLHLIRESGGSLRWRAESPEMPSVDVIADTMQEAELRARIALTDLVGANDPGMRVMLEIELVELEERSGTEVEAQYGGAFSGHTAQPHGRPARVLVG